MSKLSRFKKAPALKLPKKLPLPSTFDEDSDDDDFITKPIKYKGTPTPKSKETLPKSPTPPPPGEDSTSEYFRQPSSRKVQSKSSNNSSSRKVEAKIILPDHSNESKNIPARSADKVKTKRTKEVPSVSSEFAEISPPLQQDDNGSEVLCPFCLKRLGDQLQGTTHVKACAKNVPIQQVIEAMQLQEKQIQEWKTLGLAFPGYRAANNTNNKKPKNAGGGAGSRSRRKKPETAAGDGDPEFELAVALSKSLHEELESRHTKENQFLIENGLEKEIGLVDIKPATAIAIPTKTLQRESNSTQAIDVKHAAAPVSRRRGKKLQVNELPLYAVSEDKKKAIICDRVTKLLDDDTEKDKIQGFYVRNELPSDAIGVPKRLIQYQDKESTLWTRAQSSLETPNESFSVLEFRDPKDKLEMSSHGSGNVPNECQSNDDVCIAIENDGNGSMGNRRNPSTFSHSRPIIETSVNKKEIAARSNQNCSTTSNSSSVRSSTASQQSIDTIRKLPRPIQDIAEMLLSRKGCDMTLYGREEKAIKCHSFMLLARCPQLLNDVIEEKTGNRTRRVVSLTDYSHRTVKAFLWYVYTGEVDKRYNTDLIDELKDLTATYGISLDMGEKRQPTETEKIRSCTVDVQTDIVLTVNSSTMTENFEVCSAETGFDSFEDYTQSQELFTTFSGGMKIDSPNNSEKGCRSTTKENLESVDMDDKKIILDNDEDVHSDVDLFEDIENELKSSRSHHSPQSERENSINGKIELQSVTSHQQHSPTTEEESQNEEDFWNDLQSPSSSLKSSQSRSSSEKKRSRSCSPLVDDSNDMYTVTQAARILDVHFAGGDAKEYMNKATKKQKLDYSVVEIIDNVNGDDKKCEVQIDNSNIQSHDNTWGDDGDFMLNIVNDTKPKSILVTPTNRLKSRRSISTPNLSIISQANNKPYISPFYNQQNSDNEPDPFADAWDDSVFANIPDEVLMKKKTPQVENNVHHSIRNVATSRGASQGDLSLTPRSRTRRRISPRDLSECDDSATATKKGSRKARGTGKTKAPPKIKLPLRLPPTKDNSQYEFNSFMPGEASRRPDPSTSQPNPLAESGNNNGKSPLLNYSLIDTPILKQELKKYGIKPLPRSKAKVLLRHIYKETHK